MDVIIRNKEGTRYRLTKYSQPTPPSSDQQLLLNRLELREFFANAQPLKPASWQTLWSTLHHRPAPTGETDDFILRNLTQLAHNSYLHMIPEGAPLNRMNEVKGNKGAPSGKGSSDDLSSPGSVMPAHVSPPRISSPPSNSSHSTPPVVSDAPPENAEQDHKNCEERGEPISMISGEEILQLIDGTLPGPIPWAWQRTYRSSRASDIGLGHGWHFSGSEHLVIEDAKLTYVDQEGRKIPFALPALYQTSKYRPEGFTLDRVGERVFILKNDGNFFKVFSSDGKASSICLLREIRHPGYKAAHSQLGRKKAEQGFVIRFLYNKSQQLVQAEGNWGKSFVFQRNAQQRISSVSLANTVTGNHKILVAYEYDEYGDLIAEKNSLGFGERYQYENHLITKRTLKTGFSFYFEWDGEDHRARCIRNYGDKGVYECLFEWDPDNSQSQVTDSRGFTESFVYNEYGQIVRHVDNEGGEHRYSYQNGRKQTYQNPLGHVTQYTFDQDHNPAGMVDPLGNRVTLGYFQNRITSVTDKDKSFWRREYNSDGQLTATLDPYGQKTQYQYHANGLVHKVTDPLGRTTLYNWNQAGELSKFTDSTGHSRTLSYDDWGQCISSEIQLSNGDSAGTVQLSYTATGKLASVITANGETSHYQYNENDQLVRYSDGQGRTTQFRYDGLSQVIERINAEGHSLKYEYDTERNLTALINENGERYEFFYDGNERLIKEVGFDGRTQHYKYDAAGHLIKHLDSGEVITEFERDAMGQMLAKRSRSLSTPDTPEQLVRFQYDAKGRLLETYNDQQFISFAYNAFGNLVKEHHSDLNAKRQRISASMQDIQFNNIWPGKRSGITLPDGQTIDYGFDQHNRLENISWNHTQITSIQRDILGREVAREQGDLITLKEYDPAGRLNKQQSFNRKLKEAGPIKRQYSYDQFGNLSQFKDNNEETNYTYDLLNRLKLVEGGTSETFDFDPANNLLAAGESNTSGTAKGNRLRMQGDRKFQYDPRGNLIQENRGKDGKICTQYKYDLHNQLVEVEKQGQTTRYQYDPLGRRISKQDSFGTTRYLWAGDQMVQEVRNNIKKTYVYEPESFRPVALVQDDQVFHYHLDHLGTPKELTSDTGRVVWQAQYHTYGNVAKMAVCEVENNLRFQGQYFDEETGLHYNRHRYYNPNSGQFISQDPIGLLGGVNNYQYVPNPTGWVDPFGLACKENKYNNLKEMEPEYRAEDLGFAKAWEGLGVEVEYLETEAERAPLEIFVKDGLITNTKGLPLDTGDAANGVYIFVMDPQGRIFAGPPRIFEFHHSSFLAGGDVASAGELEVASGILLRNNSESGHYKPTEAHNNQFIQEMKERGIDAEKTREHRNKD